MSGGEDENGLVTTNHNLIREMSPAGLYSFYYRSWNEL